MSGVELEDFDTGDRRPRTVFQAGTESSSVSDQAALEAARVGGYEEGYKSGWDDAAKAAEGRIKGCWGPKLARNLRDLSFSYYEARDEVLGALEPFLEELLGTIFPELLPEAVAAAMARELSGLAGGESSGGIRLMVSPDDAETVRNLVTERLRAQRRHHRGASDAPGSGAN